MLPKEAIDEFKKIYFQEEGIKLSDAEAEEKANLIFDLFLDLTARERPVQNEIRTA